MGHPSGYYTATKSTLTDGKQGKWYRYVKKKSDEQKNTFRQDLQNHDTSHGDIKFTEAFDARDQDTEI